MEEGGAGTEAHGGGQVGLSASIGAACRVLLHVCGQVSQECCNSVDNGWLSFDHDREPGANQVYIVHGCITDVLYVVGGAPGENLFMTGDAVNSINPHQFGIDELYLDFIPGCATEQGNSNNCNADDGFH